MDEKTKLRQDELIEMVSGFCDDKLNDEFADLAVKLVEKMGRKHKVPFKRGRLDIWASAVIYCLAQVNMLFDKNSKYYISADTICGYFGTKKSTVSQKANKITSMFNLSQLDPEFTLQETSSANMDKFFDDVYYLFSMGFVKKAMSMLDKIGEDSPEYGRALFYKSVISASAGDEEAAEKLYRESVIAEVSKNSGIAVEDLRNDDFDNVNEEMHDMSDAVRKFHRGYEYYEKGEYKTALNYFDKSLELNPNDSETVYYKALCIAYLGDAEIAVDMINRAIEMDSTQDRYWNDKANFLTSLGNFDEALKCFDKAIELNPTDSILYANKGFMYLQLEDYKKSLECYKQAYEIDSENMHNIVRLANAYVELDDFKNADKYFAKAASIDDENEEYLTTRAHYLAYRDRTREALELWDKLLKFNPDNAEAWMYKAMIYLIENNTFEASRCIEKAAEIDPEIIDIFEKELSED